jgi:hypothetical protein
MMFVHGKSAGADIVGTDRALTVNCRSANQEPDGMSWQETIPACAESSFANGFFSAQRWYVPSGC